MTTDYVSVTDIAGVSNNYAFPYPWNPVYPYLQPYGNSTLIWPTVDEGRIAALVARLDKLERENRRLKKGLARLYIERRQQRQKEAQ